MTLTELRYIAAVAQHRHFGRAAESCFVSQPTLSVAVKKLEEQLGVTLFERSRTEINVTPIGEQIVAQARKVLGEVDVLEQLAAADRDELGTPLRLGIIYTIGPYLLPPLIARLREEAPDMTLLVTENFTDALADDLREGDLDAAILSLPFDQPGIVTQDLYDEEFIAVLPAEHPLAAQEEVTAEALAAENLLLLKARNCFRDQVLSACPACAAAQDDEDSLARTLEGSSLDTIRHMTAAGAGVTVLPSTSINRHDALEALLAYRPFAAPRPKRTVCLAYRRSFTRPNAIACIRRAVLESGLEGVSKYPI